MKVATRFGNGSRVCQRTGLEPASLRLCRYVFETNSAPQKKMVMAGHVARALNAALVLVDLTTREDHFLCERVAMPACSHVAKSSSAQVLCVTHTKRATGVSGCAQCSNTRGQGRCRQPCTVDDASPAQRATYEHVSRVRKGP